VCKTREKKRVDVLGLPWAGDNATRDGIVNLVTFARCKVQEDPNVDPAIRLLVAKQLRVIHREHKDSVVVLDSTVLQSVKISIAPRMSS